MVKVTAPAMSLDASGSIAGTMVFSKWKGRNYVRQLVRPSNPKSGGQVYNRAMFKFLSERWKSISTGDKATWQTLADELKASTFNAYVRQCMRDHQSALAPMDNATTARPGTAAGTPSLTITTGVKRNTVSIAKGSGATPIGYALYGKLGSAPTGVATELIAVVPYTAATSTWIHTDPATGTWHYKATAFTGTGDYSAISTDASGGAV